jgi:hypothetical protein
MKAIQDYTAGTHTYGYGITGSHLNNAQERIFVTRGHHLVTKPRITRLSLCIMYDTRPVTQFTCVQNVRLSVLSL